MSERTVTPISPRAVFLPAAKNTCTKRVTAYARVFALFFYYRRHSYSLSDAENNSQSWTNIQPYGRSFMMGQQLIQHAHNLRSYSRLPKSENVLLHRKDCRIFCKIRATAILSLSCEHLCTTKKFR